VIEHSLGAPQTTVLLVGSLVLVAVFLIGCLVGARGQRRRAELDGEAVSRVQTGEDRPADATEPLPSLQELTVAVDGLRSSVEVLVEGRQVESGWEQVLLQVVDDGPRCDELRQAMEMLVACNVAGSEPRLALELTGHLMVLAAGARSDQTRRSDAYSVLSRIGGVSAALGADGASPQWCDLFRAIEGIARASFGVGVRLIVPTHGGRFDPERHERLDGEGDRVAEVHSCGLVDTDDRVVIRKAQVTTQDESPGRRVRAANNVLR
jgi:hypothetical protein